MQTTIERRTQLQPKQRMMSRREFEYSGQTGVYGPEERLELIEGKIFAKLSPQLTPHAVCTQMAADEIREMLPQGFHVRVKAPMSLNDYNEPEPDIVVVPGAHRDYMPDHPSTAVLVIEVSDTTLRFDLNKKAAIYARALVPDYWVINLNDRHIHVRPFPVDDSSPT